MFSSSSVLQKSSNWLHLNQLKHLKVAYMLIHNNTGQLEPNLQ